MSWIRLSDYRILTNGLTTFTTDKRYSDLACCPACTAVLSRFRLLHPPGGSEWTLELRSVRQRDEGGYQCQAATPDGVKTLSSWLWVNRPAAAILGGREKHVSLGDSVTFTCELRGTLQPPQFVFWYHNQRYCSKSFNLWLLL